LSEAGGKSLEIVPDAQEMPAHQSLHDPRHSLPHVLRVLLHNAVNHGETGPIQANAVIAGGYWVLTLTNRGRFSDSVLRREFHDISSREDLGQKSFRVHIGLGTSYPLVEEAGGFLDLSNEVRDGFDYARVELRWPLQSNE
jgi:hypothetical protein